MIHPSAVVDEGAIIGEGTRVWHFSHVMGGAVVGSGCMVGQGCFVSGRAVLGNRVRLQNNVSVYDGVVLEEDVFCGPSAVFTNVLNPRAAVDRRAEFRTTRVRRGATIGANATILPGVTIGEYAFVGAGSTVTKDVPAFGLVVGVPARRIGWMSAHGARLEFDAEGQARCKETGERYRLLDGRATRTEPASDR